MIAQMTASRSVVRDYITLTKPRVISLLLVTALGGMFLATKGVPQLSLVLVVLGGGLLASGGANALNHFMDRDLDELMTRTRNRPVVRGTVSPRSAMIFGIVLNIIAFVVLSAGANLLSALLTLSATLFYVFIYTKALKRTTPQNIVIGGAAGAIPPMVGWAAVTGYLGLPALYLFAIIFFWTPPHFWALALMLKDDYARAKVPMLPVVVGVDETKKYIFIYTWLVLGLTLMFFTTGVLGWLYLGVSTALGIGFIYYAWRLLRRPEIKGAKPLYLYSLAYLAALFLLIMIESSVAI